MFMNDDLQQRWWNLEASLVERLEKVEVHVVPGSDRNIKITKPSDLELAQLYLQLEQAVKTPA